jgi:hypothetical protein
MKILSRPATLGKSPKKSDCATTPSKWLSDTCHSEVLGEETEKSGRVTIFETMKYFAEFVLSLLKCSG